MRVLLPLLSLLALAACTGRLAPDTAPVEPGPPLDVTAPPSGALSRSQLAAVAADIREVEANPLGRGADEARRVLFVWLTGSPDIDVRLCRGVTGAFADSDSYYSAQLLAHFTLGLAAHLIETPEDAGDTAALNTAAMRSALAAYENFLDRDPRAKDRHMDRMLVRQRAGTLDEYIESATANC